MDLDTTRRGRNLLTAALIAAALTITGTITAAAASHGLTPLQAAAGDCLRVHHGSASDADVDVVSCENPTAVYASAPIPDFEDLDPDPRDDIPPDIHVDR
jgi:hypothetical protein